jgi:penicillin-binding protein 1B
VAAEITLPARKSPVIERGGEKRQSVKRTVVISEKRTSLKRAAVICGAVAAILIAIAVVTFAIITYNSYSSFALMLDQQIAGGFLRSHAGLYAAPRVIEKGARLSPEQLITSLQRAGYAPGAASNVWSGSFQVSDHRVRILPRQGTETYQWVDVSFDNRGLVSKLSANDAGDIRSYALEPELLTPDAGVKTGRQELLTYSEIPPVLVEAILAIEDRRFFQHNGVDVHGVSRAFVSWATSGSIKFHQGGSTITQQLVKNTYLTPEKTLKRKFDEAMIAVALEQRLSKQDIFALYCNEVYLGQRNGVGVRGVSQAAHVFFGKELKDLSLAEAATIAGMIQSPARYAPDRKPEAARSRRDQVIAAMVREGSVDADAAQQVTGSPVNVAAFESSASEFAPYYVDAVNRAMDEVPDDTSRSSERDADQNIRVQTTISPDLQTAAEKALRHQLNLLRASAKGDNLPQGALVAMDVHTGQVLAMVGGRNYAESQLNRATDAQRQPGSVFKPFVYATAFDAGISPFSLSRDEPQTFQYGNAIYAPANFGKAYSMHEVILREGLVRSLNVVTVNLAMRTGLAKIANTAGRFGLPVPNSYPSMALGTSEVTPLQMAAAYSAFANGGKFIAPRFIAGTVGSTGESQPGPSFETQQVISPTTAYLITDILTDVIKRGTARRASGALKQVAIAGKTGTSRDGWFVGYTPNLVCAVWIGFDDNKQLGMTGAEAALPAWVEFMQEAVAIRPSLGGATFPKPGNIVTVRIDPESGQLAGPNCPTSQRVSVPARFAPQVECLKHMPDLDYELEASASDLGTSPYRYDFSDVNASGETDAERVENPAKPARPNNELPADPQMRKRATETELNENGQPRLIQDPTRDESRRLKVRLTKQ